MSDTTTTTPVALSNCPHYDAAINSGRLVGGNYVTLRKNKREFMRSLVLAIAVESYDQKTAINAAKAAMKFAVMAKDEKNNANVMFANVRTVTEAWPTLADDVKKLIVANEGPAIATLAGDIRKAEKEAEEEAAKRLAETETTDATTTETPSPSDEVTAPATTDNVAAINAVTALIGTDLTEDESIAMIALFDAVDAYRSLVVETEAPAPVKAPTKKAA